MDLGEIVTGYQNNAHQRRKLLEGSEVPQQMFWNLTPYMSLSWVLNHSDKTDFCEVVETSIDLHLGCPLLFYLARKLLLKSMSNLFLVDLLPSGCPEENV